MSQKRILLSGYYGFGNTGDEAILKSILTGLRQKNKEIEFTVVSGNPAQTSRVHNVHAVHWKNISETIEAARQSDLIILGGGGLFQDYHPASIELTLTPEQWGIPYYSGFAMLARLTNKPFMLYSVGVGPLFTEEGRQMTRMAFETAVQATVRDIESYNLLKSLGIDVSNVVVTADPAFSLEANYLEAEKVLANLPEPIIDTSELVGVCIRKWDINTDETEWQKNLANALDKFIDTHHSKVIFVPFQSVENVLTNDTTAAEAVMSMMRNRQNVQIIPGEHDVSTLNALIGKCRIFVGMRLHSIIFSAKEMVPPVALVYDGKVANIMNSLSLGKYAISLASLSVEQVLEAMEESWQQHDKLRLHLKDACQDLRQRAEQNIDIALRLIDQSASIAPKQETPNEIKEFALKQTYLLLDEHKKYLEAHNNYSLQIKTTENLNKLIEKLSKLMDEKETANQSLVQSNRYFAAQVEQLNNDLAYLRQGWRKRYYLRAKALAVRVARAILRFVPARIKQPLRAIYLSRRYTNPNASIAQTIEQTNREFNSAQTPPAPKIEQVVESKRINILTPQFFDMEGGNIFLGGAERYLVELVKMLKEQGYVPHVYQGANESWDRDFEGMHITGLPSKGSDNSLLRNLFLNEVTPGWVTIYLAFYLADLGAPPRSIGISHGVYWDEPGFQDPLSLQYRLNSILSSFQNLDKVVSVDTNTINWVRGIRSILADKFTYIPNFVDSQTFKPQDNRVDDGRIRIVYPRRLYKARGFWLVREVLDDIVQEFPQVEFHFVGQANLPEETEVQKLMFKYPQQVRWYDLPFNRMFEAYQRADITLIPTVNSEGTSLSCLEAMASRNTIIATNIGGLTDLIIPSFNGLLIEPNPTSLKESLELLIKDANLRKTLANNAYETAKSFEINQWKMRWAKLLSHYYKN